MANNLEKNTSQKVLEVFVPGFMDDRVLLNTVETQLITGQINPTTGAQVQMKVPHQYEVLRTAKGDTRGQDSSPLISATRTARISDYITIRIDYLQLEEAIELNQLDEILKPAYKKMTTEFERELANFMIANAGLLSGVPEQPIDAWGNVAGCGSYLTALGVDDMEMYATMNPWACQDLADTQSGLASGDNNLVNAAWRKAQISKDFGGLQAFMSNSLESFESGTSAGAAGVTVSAPPIVTYTGLKDSVEFTVSLEGLTSGATFTVGQPVEFTDTLMLNQQNKSPLVRRSAGVPFVGIVKAAATADGGGAVTLTLSGTPVFDDDLPQYNVVSRAITSGDTVRIEGVAGKTYQPGLFYTKGFVGVGTVELPPLNDTDSTIANVDGFSIRATKYSDEDGNIQKMRLDMLPAFCCYNATMGGQFYGNV